MATIEQQSTRDSAPPKVSDAFVRELRTNAARVPAIPVRPLTGLEVAVAVRYALDEGGQDLPLDLSAMKRIVIDPHERTARVQPGVTAAELEQAAFYWGLAPLVDRSGFVPTLGGQLREGSIAAGKVAAGVAAAQANRSRTSIQRPRSGRLQGS